MCRTVRRRMRGGGDGIGHLVGKTGKDGSLAAEDGRLGAQRPQRVETLAPASGDGFSEELTQILNSPAIRARTASGSGW